jgi:hypothetical protein
MCFGRVLFIGCLALVWTTGEKLGSMLAAQRFVVVVVVIIVGCNPKPTSHIQQLFCIVATVYRRCATGANQMKQIKLNLDELAPRQQGRAPLLARFWQDNGLDAIGIGSSELALVETSTTKSLTSARRHHDRAPGSVLTPQTTATIVVAPPWCSGALPKFGRSRSSPPANRG